MKKQSGPGSIDFPATRKDSTATSNLPIVSQNPCSPPDARAEDREKRASSAPQLMSVEALGRYLDVSKNALYRLVKSGQLPAVKIGHQWRMNLEEVQNCLIDAYERKIYASKKRKHIKTLTGPG